MRFDNLAKQILGKDIVLMFTKQDALKNVEDEEYVKDGEKIIKTKEEKIKDFDKYLSKLDLKRIGENDLLIHKFVLNGKFTKLNYMRFKELSKISYYDLITNAFLLDELLDLFSIIFKEIIFNGEKQEVELIDDLKTILSISIEFLAIFEIRLHELKKKLQ